MGLVLKRRDNAPIVKHFYAGVVDILMRHTDTPDFHKWVAENPGADQRQHPTYNGPTEVLQVCSPRANIASLAFVTPFRRQERTLSQGK